jgi:hypothetical protein
MLTYFPSDLASNEIAWHETRDSDGLQHQPFPGDSMIWGTASTRDATSWTHIDDHGMVTVVTVVAGLKYWVLAVPKRASDKSKSKKNTSKKMKDLNGDMGTIKAFGKGWSPSTACDSLWDHEAILLGPSDTL